MDKHLHGHPRENTMGNKLVMEAVSFQQSSPRMFMNYPSLSLKDGTWLIKVITVNKLALFRCHGGTFIARSVFS